VIYKLVGLSKVSYSVWLTPVRTVNNSAPSGPFGGVKLRRKLIAAAMESDHPRERGGSRSQHPKKECA
jgi:hypothetical protein